MKTVKEVIAKAPRFKPTLSLDQHDLPAIKNWKVGSKYRVMLTVEQISSEKGNEWDDSDSKEMRARFKVLKAKECSDEDS